MGQNIIKAVLFFLTVIALYSCASMGTIPIQETVPPKNHISSDIQSIAIFNRCMTRDFINLKGDSISIEKRIGNNDLPFIKTFFDSTAADTAIKIAAKAIFDSQRFDVVVPLNLNIIRNDNRRIPDPLDSIKIRELCNLYKVEGILVLESFSEKVARRIHNPWDSYTGTIDLSYNSTWRFYQPMQNPAYFSLEVRDAIFWQSSYGNPSLKNLYENLPTIKEALIGGGLALGSDIGERFIPRLVDVTRSYYITRNEKIDSAIPLIKNDKWEEASQIWMKYSLETSKSLRSKIEFNLALASEMTGNLDQAIEWGVKSLKSKYSWNTELYLKDLDALRSGFNEINKFNKD